MLTEMPRSAKIIYAVFIVTVFAGLMIGFIGSGESFWVPLILGLFIVGGMLLVARWLTVKTGLSREWERQRERSKEFADPDASLRETPAQRRAQARKLLTPRERRFALGYTLASAILAPVAVGLLVFGTSSIRGLGIGLLLVALVVMAVPISPFLRAKVRRRAGGSSGP